MYTYLIINIAVILVPLLFSFNRKINYYRNWKFLFPSLFITAILFIGWDIYFTMAGVWSFNPLYLSGPELFHLPLEEWLFFISIPYSCLFIYESIGLFLNIRATIHVYLPTLILAAVLALLGIFNLDKMYTCTTFILTSLLLLFHGIRKSGFLNRFYIMYAISLIPFFIVNGILTALPVVIYNNSENLCLRIHTIPVEDLVYSMLLLLVNVSIFEWLRNSINVPETKKAGAGS